MKTLLSLFDHTGNWPHFFSVNGWNVIHVDLQNWISIDVNSIKSAHDAFEIFGDVDGILAAPPCTDFTSSGAQYWPAKDACGTTEESLELVKQVMRLADLYTPTDPDYYYDGDMDDDDNYSVDPETGLLVLEVEPNDNTFFWCMENPVGRLPKLLPGLGKPKYFHPYEYAGYLKLGKTVTEELDRIRKKNGRNITDIEADLILATNTYTKKTGLWGNFTMPEPKPVEQVKGAPQGSVLQRFGGKSIETKNKRSATPMGFAKAFFEANVNHQAEANMY